VQVIPFVKKEYGEVARKIEQLLMELPLEAGVLFAGVVVDISGEDPIFKLTLGVHRELRIGETAYAQMATLHLQELLLKGHDIQVDVKRGVVRG
jgi:hypothetical protein